MKRSIVLTVVALFLTTSLASYAEKAPNFVLPGIKSEVKLSKYRGRVVYVDFWASWCTPCRKSFPWMGELQKRYGADLKVIAINVDQERDEAISFLKKNKPKFTVAFDPKGEVAEAYKVKGMPNSYIIDQQGRLVDSHVGFNNADKVVIEGKIEKLIARKKRVAVDL